MIKIKQFISALKYIISQFNINSENPVFQFFIGLIYFIFCSFENHAMLWQSVYSKPTHTMPTLLSFNKYQTGL